MPIESLITDSRHSLVTGMTRSGSTLLGKLLDAHPEVSCAAQPFPLLYVEVMRQFHRSRDRGFVFHALGTLFRETSYSPGALVEYLEGAEVDRTTLERWLTDMESYSGQMTRFPDRAAVLGAATPGTLVQTLSALLETAATGRGETVFAAKEVMAEEFLPFLLSQGFRAVMTVRDPRDVIASMSYGGQAGAWVGDPRPVLFNIRNWRKSVMFAIHLASQDGFTHVRYEDLATDLEGQLTRVTDLLGVAPFESDAFDGGIPNRDGTTWRGNSSYEEKSLVSTSSIGRFREILPPEVVRYVETLCLPEMLWLGYEPETVDDLDPVVLEGFVEPVPITRDEFDPGYSTDPAEVAGEKERMRLLNSGSATPAEQIEFFRFADVAAALSEILG